VRTLLDGARALRDAGERERAHAQFDAVARRARELDLAWMELAAISGAALSNGGPASEASRRRWERATELVGDARPEWWFPGRELADAFAVQVALASGHPSVANDIFARAVHRLGALDAYGSLWLVAECAPALTRAGWHSAERALVDATQRARRLGFPLHAASAS
jgi:hypothetical protein